MDQITMAEWDLNGIESDLDRSAGSFSKSEDLFWDFLSAQRPGCDLVCLAEHIRGGNSFSFWDKFGICDPSGMVDMSHDKTAGSVNGVC